MWLPTSSVRLGEYSVSTWQWLCLTVYHYSVRLSKTVNLWRRQEGGNQHVYYELNCNRCGQSLKRVDNLWWLCNSVLSMRIIKTSTRVCSASLSKTAWFSWLMRIKMGCQPEWVSLVQGCIILTAFFSFTQLKFLFEKLDSTSCSAQHSCPPHGQLRFSTAVLYTPGGIVYLEW